jgi:hypothetical protein
MAVHVVQFIATFSDVQIETNQEMEDLRLKIIEALTPLYPGTPKYDIGIDVDVELIVGAYNQSKE